MAADDRLTIGDVAARLGVSVDTVRRVRRDDLPWQVTPGGHRRYAAEDVETYLAELDTR